MNEIDLWEQEIIEEAVNRNVKELSSHIETFYTHMLKHAYGIGHQDTQ